MDLALNILTWLGIVLGALLALVLFVPLHLKAKGSLSGLSGQGKIRASWGWFVLIFNLDSDAGARIRLFGLTISRLKGGHKNKPSKKSKSKKEKKPKEKTAGGFGHYWRNRQVLMNMVGRMLATLHLRGRISGVVGLDDPSDTAWLDTALWQVRGRWSSFEMDVASDFSDEVLELDGEIKTWIWPIHVVLVGVWLMLSSRNRRALRAGA